MEEEKKKFTRGDLFTCILFFVVVPAFAAFMTWVMPSTASYLVCTSPTDWESYSQSLSSEGTHRYSFDSVEIIPLNFGDCSGMFRMKFTWRQTFNRDYEEVELMFEEDGTEYIREWIK